MAKVKQQELDGNGNLVDKAPAAKAPKAPKEPKAAKPKVKSVKTYIFKNDAPEGVKIAPQLRIIIGHIKDAGEAGISLGDLVKVVEANEAFQTRQPVSRVITYYTPTLVEKGIVAVDKVETEVAAEAPAETTEEATA
jgi:hypothetical protein